MHFISILSAMRFIVFVRHCGIRAVYMHLILLFLTGMTGKVCLFLATGNHCCTCGCEKKKKFAGKWHSANGGKGQASLFSPVKSHNSNKCYM